MSFVPPAANGTMSVIGLLGQAGAWARTGAVRAVPRMLLTTMRERRECVMTYLIDGGRAVAFATNVGACFSAGPSPRKNAPPGGMSPDTEQSLRTDSCLVNPSGLQAARWTSRRGATSVGASFNWCGYSLLRSGY